MKYIIILVIFLFIIIILNNLSLVSSIEKFTDANNEAEFINQIDKNFNKLTNLDSSVLLNKSEEDIKILTKEEKKRA